MSGPRRSFARPGTPPSWRRYRRARAFTLPEVLATLLLTGIVLPAVMHGISLSMAACDEARRKVEATALAENKLAELQAQLTNNLQAGTSSGDFGSDWPAYRWESEVAARSEATDLAELQVRVVWNGRGVDRFVSVSTMVYVGTGTSTDSTSSSSSSSSSSATGSGGSR
jgi:type II secretory pathway pseudopilin PulG